MATQSLYRRYRPRRFGELKGQDHVVRALRDAVRAGREGQAYLFSGPRGTGKTSSARILAKVLNCEQPVDGEPCCQCDSCLAVERGTSYDVFELDAASNNGVDAIRDLIEKASLGTPGRHKVYILDEAHMLSKQAEAALLKTLEEPPPHVVFVLATTDPQKMSDTIRSRTQHLQFHLLPADTLAEHLRWVAADAGLDLSDEAFDQVIDQGAGSARDALSALELMAATGGDVSDRLELDEFVQAMIEHEPGRALTATAHAISLGHDPRTLTDALVRHLRNGFLSLMAPELVQLPDHRVDQLAAAAQQLGPASLVRAMERLGTAMVEMRHAPDPRILLEVALVQLTHEAVAEDLGAVIARLDRLERAFIAGGTASSPAAAPVDPASGRAVLGGRARTTTAAAAAAPAATPAPTSPAPTAPAPSTPAPSTPAPGRPAPSSPTVASPAGTAPAGASPPTEAPPTTPSAVDVSVPDAWAATVRPSLKPFVRALYSAGSFTRHDGEAWYFSVPNAAHGERCEAHRAEVESALSATVGSPVRIVISVGGASPAGHDAAEVNASDTAGAGPPSDTDTTPGTTSPGTTTPGTTTAPGGGTAGRASTTPDDDVDLDDLVDAPPESALSPIDRIAQAFPGAELIQDDR